MIPIFPSINSKNNYYLYSCTYQIFEKKFSPPQIIGKKRYLVQGRSKGRTPSEGMLYRSVAQQHR
jgi:hypothetical protein